MTLKDRLGRAIGHAPDRPDVGASSAEAAQEIAALRRRLRRVRRERDRAQRELDKLAARQAKRSEFPRDFDEQFREIIRLVRDYTMTDNMKLHALLSATQYLVRYGIAGDFVECGTWRGGSMHAAARMLTALGDQSRDLYLFDTFQGMPPPTEVDARGDTTAAELLAESERDTWMWAVASLEDVKAGFAAVPYPSERVHFVPGKVEETIPAELPERIALLRLDTDWYESTAHELEHAYGRLVPGGVLIIDDYSDWDGARLATDQFLQRTPDPLFLVRMSGGRVAVKPYR